MKRLSTLILTWIFMQSCIPQSTENIKKIEAPDKSIIDKFGIKPTGEIIYQFYQKYGLTDLEEHLIMIVRPANTKVLTLNLPFDSLVISRLEHINFGKFVKNSPVDFSAEKTNQADIRLEAKEFDSGKERAINYGRGKYKIIRNDSVETLFVYDKQAKLLYIESKRY